ncbi:MAG TPA: phosphoglucomutase/phosphomannomutase family protein [Candidatus Polarisedimenticolia bacterium]|nr:phosphoglucomutase/phosphomannomutase family protein [Candidatus Polarisedimenticolia bacterium]
MPAPIKFGTSGWRAIIADEFTFPNVRRVSLAIADTLREAGLAGRGVVVGYDTRFGSERFAEESARALASRGIRCVLSRTPIPTPAVAHAVRHHRFGGAINITASHNPAEYNGLKFSTEQGAPAPLAITQEVERRAAQIEEQEGPIPLDAAAAALIERQGDFLDPYLEQLDGLVRFEAVRKAGLRVGIDPRWGVARGWLDAALKRHDVPFEILHDHRDVTFGGGGPDVSARNLEELGRMTAERGLGLGIACDGDADRFGVVDADGSWINPNLLLALLADYLAETRGFRLGLGRTYATTGLLDAVARHHGVAVHQTPVGFKYLGELILQGDKVYLAGEESAGMSMAGHVPEKDGLLAGLLAAEMVAVTGRTIAGLRDDLFAKVGPLHSARLDFRVTQQQVARLRQAMAAPPAALGARSVARATVWDGLRLDFEDGSWLLMRPSGTEPVVRYYVEAPTPEGLEELQRAGRAALIGDSA